MAFNIVDALSSTIGRHFSNQAFPTATVSVNGYTDNSGDAATNTTLSTQRAEAVKGALVSKGITADRIAAAGLAATNPLHRTTRTKARLRIVA